jgi:PD-(D/E)XK nuclease superfamily
MMTTTKRIIHSHSSLDMHKKCPQQYHQVRILKRFPYEPGPEAIRGDKIHKALEEYGRDATPMPPEYAQFAKVVDDYVTPLAGTKYFEHQFDFTADGMPISNMDWNNKALTGKADVLVVDGRKALVLDWKTGKAGYPNTKQLERMAVFTMWKFIGVDTVVGVLAFIEHDGEPTTKGEPVVTKTYTRSQLPGLVATLKAEMNAVQYDLQKGYWEMRPSPLCPWCPAKDCPNWTPPKEKK